MEAGAAIEYVVGALSDGALSQSITRTLRGE